ncbi:MAG TPA: radical SAM family heme chaperone HemW [Stellaceae bacterium]|nr:radical SAM family heme chaperone HemW [Stellaceae bacterium]
MSPAETAAGEEAGFALYVHWPFCLSKCPYCDFNSHVRETVDQARWRAALLAEIDYWASLVGRTNRAVTSVFFGGGTPSLMPPETVAAVLDRIAGHWPMAAGVEITLEGNPTSIEAGRYQAYRLAGVNRVSLGVQALNDRDLKFLGRGHSAGEAIAAIALAARLFDRYSFDLIYARPDQTEAGWAAELEQAISLAGSHLSVYQLTIEPGTAFHTAHARGDLVVPDEDLAAALFELTQDRLAAAGMPGYEISNHARPGEASRHNLTYWRYGDYLGIGPGAHGRLTLDGEKRATRQFRAPETWLTAVEAAGHGTQEMPSIPAEDRLAELVMMGLRLAEGIPRARFRTELGTELETLLDPTGLARLIEGGFVTLDAERLTATAEGRQRLNAVLGMLLR